MLDVQVRTKSWLEINGRFAIGPHGFELLSAIDRCQSLKEAAGVVGWSYRHAWNYVRRAEKAFDCPLVTTRSGKGRARGTVLSPLGRDVLRVATTLRATPRAVRLKQPSGRPPAGSQTVRDNAGSPS